MTVLTVANPFFRLGHPTGTGSEAVAAALDRAILARGWKSLVIAAEGSQPAGRLAATLPADPAMTAAQFDLFMKKFRRRFLEIAEAADIIHFHGIGFAKYLPVESRNIVVTIHAARSYYAPNDLNRPGLQYVAVSRHQARTLADVRELRVIQNGIDLGLYRPRCGKRERLVFIGRIGREKGVDLALRAAHILGLPLTLVGPLPAFPANQEYFRRAVAPLLDGRREYIGTISTEERVDLLRNAICALIPSHGPGWQETSCLVAMEAISCGVPVVGFRLGALPETVEHGSTGILANSFEEMVRGVTLAARLSPAVCRAQAEHRFDSRRMAAQYLACYGGA